MMLTGVQNTFTCRPVTLTAFCPKNHEFLKKEKYFFLVRIWSKLVKDSKELFFRKGHKYMSADQVENDMFGQVSLLYAGN